MRKRSGSRRWPVSWACGRSSAPSTHSPHLPDPTTGLYVISDQGRLVARYDKRFLSHTELSYLYTPGRPEPTVFEVDGVRFGLATCIEANFPALFAEYERLDVECVLLSVMVDDPARATVAQAYGTLYNYWLGYAVPAQYAAHAPSGVVAPGGRWLDRAPADNLPALAVADLDLDSADRFGSWRSWWAAPGRRWRPATCVRSRRAGWCVGVPMRARTGVGRGPRVFPLVRLSTSVSGFAGLSRESCIAHVLNSGWRMCQSHFATRVFRAAGSAHPQVIPLHSL
ncbi:carbon-nitrogen hydrolase family protein [Kitasatospora sp. NPDC050463]|uniref:carbon-nitrogen hydrolase family protein n=1 Tax=Kitasatospora sp. NPDC050463 TaxID=3155786 RepID=UPI0033F76018